MVMMAARQRMLSQRPTQPLATATAATAAAAAAAAAVDTTVHRSTPFCNSLPGSA